MFSKLFLTSSVCFMLVGCVGPDYQGPPDMGISDKWHADQSTDEALAFETDWWNLFNDPLLDRYIMVAAANNKDLDIARANIEKARAQRREDVAAFWPDISGSASGTKSRTSEKIGSAAPGAISKFYDSGFDASWELDVFGGTRRSVEAADARLGSSVASYQDTMLTVLAEVGRNYYEARGLQKRIKITKESVDLLKQTAAVVKARVEAGVSNEFDLARATAQYDLTSALIPNLEAEWKSSLYSLAVLLGRPPEGLLEDMRDLQPLPAPADAVPVGLRSDILRRRPDVASAERDLAASVADIGVNTADLFPKFFLTGKAVGQALTFGDVFTAAAGAWSLGSSMTWSVFEGGAVRARIKEAEADQKAAFATYEKTVLEALKDAESALIRYGKEVETRKRLEKGLKNRRKAVAMVQDLFDAGEEDYLSVLDTERELVATQDDWVVSETQSVTKLISLYKALGGGWQHFDQDGKMIKPEEKPAKAKK